MTARRVKFSLLGTRLFLFFRQEFFDRKRKIKFRFFLVDVGHDFYSQARAGGEREARVNKM
jgi:hypothetical protein